MFCFFLKNPLFFAVRKASGNASLDGMLFWAQFPEEGGLVMPCLS
jgi:hypothetical protein